MSKLHKAFKQIKLNLSNKNQLFQPMHTNAFNQLLKLPAATKIRFKKKKIILLYFFKL